MNSNSEVETSKTNIKDYFLYAALGGILHPLAGGAFSYLLVGLDALYANYVSNEISLFTGSVLIGTSPLGLFVCVPMFISAGALYSVVFGFIYNATSHGKASSRSNRVLYNILFSLVMAVIGPIGVFIILQALNQLLS